MSEPLFFATYKVYINHTDAGGIVYHANHLTFFENCRRDWLASLGFDGYFFNQTKEGLQESIHFVVSRANICYKQPLLIDDKLIVSIDKLTINAASLVVEQSIYRSHDDFAANKSASAATITLACVCHHQTGMRPHRLPAALLLALTKHHQIKTNCN